MTPTLDANYWRERNKLRFKAIGNEKCRLSEDEFKAEVLKRLSPAFIIDHEIEGRHVTGARLRIDAVLKPIERAAWKRPSTTFGVEFKSEVVGQTRDATALIRQAIDYAHTDWDRYGFLPILICPAVLSHRHKHYSGAAPADANYVLRLLGEFLVGEIVTDDERLGVTLRMKDHPMWCERDGILQGKHWALERKIGGSR